MISDDTVGITVAEPRIPCSRSDDAASPRRDDATPDLFAQLENRSTTEPSGTGTRRHTVQLALRW
jgi:hypothetical protein